MEEILNKIFNRLDSIDNRFDSVENRLGNLEEGQQSMNLRLGTLEAGQQSMNLRLGTLEEGQQSMQFEQSEMRKEVAFYYGSLMKKIDETKSEISSEIKHVSNVQKQHQDVLEILNEKQQ